MFNGLKGVQRTFLRYYLYERHKTNKIGWHSRAKFYIWGLFYSLNYKSRYIALQYTKTKHLLCKAHINDKPAVLLIDEVDRADEEFEAFLFELLAEGSVTIPELGTIFAKVPPIVILSLGTTNNATQAPADSPTPSE